MRFPRPIPDTQHISAPLKNRPRCQWLLPVLLCAGTLTLLVAAGCGKNSSSVQSADADFLGNAACAPCHRKEFEEHRGSRHAVTFREVTKENMGKFWPALGDIKGADLAIFTDPNGIAMGWKNLPESSVPMRYALGSDRFAFTFINISNNQNVVELRETFYPPNKEWHPTPGHAYVSRNAVGRTYNEDISRHCLGCHVVTLPAKGITPEPRFYGVGCESCHGPGKQHVDAVGAKSKDLHMANLGKIGARQLNELCGKCHRTEKDIPPEQLTMTNRFEPYGLMKSKCFLNSKDTLSCNTCHNPHLDASADRKSYEKACLRCHAPTPSFGPSETVHKSCKVNPRSGCIPCHMPQRKVTDDAPFSMSDHYIRVFSEDELTEK